MQSDCNAYRDLLWSYVAKELSESESKKIEEHLQGCPSCRQEAEALAQITASFREEVPLPAIFSEELHEKLVLVAEEMATEKPSLKERLAEGIKSLSRHGAFRSLAPALVCLVLVVGVFSSGLFDQWNSADKILTDPIATTPVSPPEPTKTDSPSVTEPDETSKSQTFSESSTSSSQSVPSKQSTTTPAPTAKGSTNRNSVSEPSTRQRSTSVPPATNDRESTTAVTPAPEAVPAEMPQASSNQPTTENSLTPVPADAGNVPAPAAEEDDPVTFAIPRHVPRASCLPVSDAETVLNGWEETSGYEWQSFVQEVPPQEIISGVDPEAIVLELSPPAATSLTDYVATNDEQEPREETLVIITGDEE